MYHAQIDEAGELVAFVLTADGVPPEHRLLEVPKGIAIECARVEGDRIIEDPSLIEAGEMARIQAEAATLRAQYLTADKGFIYAQKLREVQSWRDMAAATLAALSSSQRQQRFPFAHADAAEHGDTIAAAIDRFEAGISASIARIAKLEARTQKALADLRAAKTVKAKREVRVRDG